MSWDVKNYPTNKSRWFRVECGVWRLFSWTSGLIGFLAIKPEVEIFGVWFLIFWSESRWFRVEWGVWRLYMTKFQFYRFFVGFLPLALRAQPCTPFFLLNIIDIHSGFLKIFFPAAARNGPAKKTGFSEKISVFSIFLENYAFSDPTILYQNDRLIKGYNHAEFQKKNFSRFRP